MKMWKVYAKTKDGQSKGGKKTQSINKEQKTELTTDEIDVIKEQNKLDDESKEGLEHFLKEVCGMNEEIEWLQSHE